MRRLKQVKQLLVGCWALCMILFWTASCDSCTQQRLAWQGETDVAVTTLAVNKLGSINDQYTIIEVEGNIERNAGNKDAALCVVLIPESEKICQSVAEFRGLKPTLDEKKPSISLPSHKGAVYYGGQLKAKQEGAVKVTIPIKHTDHLTLSGNYQVHLMTYATITEGTPYCNKGKIIDLNISTNSVNPIATLVVDKVGAPKIDDRQYEVHAEATPSNNLGGINLEGGFLFIETKAVSDPSFDLPTWLLGIIKDRRTLAEGLLDLKKSMICCPVVTGTLLYNFTQKTDTDPRFKIGSTYQVYAYAVDTATNTYIVSEQQDKFITLVSPEAKLKMGKAELLQMIKNSDAPQPDVIQVSVEGLLEEHKGTFAPQIGFVFVPTGVDATKVSDSTWLSNAMTQLIDQGKSAVKIDQIIIVLSSTPCNRTTKGAFVGECIDPTLFELGKNYEVHCWLRDGAAVFISDNFLPLSIPDAKLKIMELRTRKQGQNFFFERNDQVTTSTGLPHGPSTWGYLIYPTTELAVQFGWLKEILQEANQTIFNKDLEEITELPAVLKLNHNNADYVFLNAPDKELTEVTWSLNVTSKRLRRNSDKILVRKAAYVSLNENILFYKLAKNKFVWRSVDSADTKWCPIVVEGINYEYTSKPNDPEFNAAAIVDVSGGRKNIINNATNSALIDKILAKVFVPITNPDNQADAGKFKNQMVKNEDVGNPLDLGDEPGEEPDTEPAEVPEN